MYCLSLYILLRALYYHLGVIYCKINSSNTDSGFLLITIVLCHCKCDLNFSGSHMTKGISHLVIPKIQLYRVLALDLMPKVEIFTEEGHFFVP